MVNGVLENAGVYTQPTGEPAKDPTFDVTVAHAADSVLSFTDIELAGNFYNGMRGGLNLVLNFDASRVQGVITATLATHYVGGSTWTVTGTSHLTALSLDATSRIAAPRGRKLTLTVDGTPTATAIATGGGYTGAIVLTPA